jgi:drug/metabolite transporter (DMT)-like permease
LAATHGSTSPASADVSCASTGTCLPVSGVARRVPARGEIGGRDAGRRRAALDVAAALFWALLLAGRDRTAIRAVARRDVLLGLLLGAAGYAVQAGAYFAALTRINASLLSLTAAGWGWLTGLAVISTVGAINLFFAGLRRVGPTSAAILATVEPLVTILLAFLAFGEVLGGVQLLGGALVLGSVVVLSGLTTRAAGGVQA